MVELLDLLEARRRCVGDEPAYGEPAVPANEVAEALPEQREPVHAGRSEWPAGFFEEVIGGWQGEPLERVPEPPFEKREPL